MTTKKTGADGPSPLLRCIDCGREGRVAYAPAKNGGHKCQHEKACARRIKNAHRRASEPSAGPDIPQAAPSLRDDEGNPIYLEPRLKYMTDEDAARLVEVEEQVMELRIRGRSFYQIERELNITNANRVFRRALARSGNVEYKRAEATRLEGERLDALQDGIWPRAMSGDPRAVEVAIKLLERRSKLYGLDFADLVGAKMADIEQAKLDLMVTAFTTALNRAGMAPAQQQTVIDVFFNELRANQLEAGDEL